VVAIILVCVKLFSLFDKNFKFQICFDFCIFINAEIFISFYFNEISLSFLSVKKIHISGNMIVKYWVMLLILRNIFLVVFILKELISINKIFPFCAELSKSLKKSLLHLRYLSDIVFLLNCQTIPYRSKLRKKQLVN